jgi:plastocyanin
MSVAAQRGYESKTGGKVTMYRLWLIFLVTLAVTTIILVGSAVAQSSSMVSVCAPDQYGKQRCDSTTDPNACIINGSIVYDQYTCDQSTQRAQQPASAQEPSAQNAPTVRIGANGFDPAQVQVAPGTPLTFVNEDTVPHTLSLKGLFDSPAIPAGSSYPVTLNGAGTVTYHDKANSQMQGTINVGGASQGEATSPAGSVNQPSQTAGESTG